MRRTGWLAGLAPGLVVGVVLGLAVGGVLGSVLAAAIASLDPPADEAPAPVTAGDRAAPAQRVRELEQALAREVERRRELEGRLAERAPPPPEPAASDPAEDAREPKPGDPWIDAEVLARGGFSPSEVDELQAQLEAIELEKLYLRDQATREGWAHEPRYARQLRELDARYGELRDRYGDEAYDWILYASGRRNRVVVQRVMEASEAASVGFEAGDVFLSYDDRRVFDARSLQGATTAGEFGRTVSVEVLRDGRVVRLFPARGPLGIALVTERDEPAEPIR